MKKNYFMLAAAAMMFAACSETDLMSEMGEMEKAQEISFESFANKTTRAEIADTAALHTNGFKVWGSKTYDNTLTTIFNGVKVYYSNNYWTYDNKKYWDETATYDFYAVAPHDGNTSIAANGMITITNVASGKSTDSKDYLIDRDGNKGVAGSKKEVVPFEFNHTMAKLSFKLKAGINDTITVTSLKMTGWDKALGTFTQQLTTTPTTNSHIEWGLATKVDGTATLVGTDATDTIIVLPSSMTEKAVTDTYIMVPQTIAANDLKFTIDFKIGDEVFTAQTGEVTTAQTWGTDTHTTYTITVAPNVINFKVDSVAGWTPTPGGSATID